jgi:hypothetical protein
MTTNHDLPIALQPSVSQEAPTLFDSPEVEQYGIPPPGKQNLCGQCSREASSGHIAASQFNGPDDPCGGEPVRRWQPHRGPRQGFDDPPK